MAVAKTGFQAYLEEELNRYKGVMMPVKTGFPRRVFIRSAACKKLHPNPEDEFCNPEIGPNYEIIARADEVKRLNACERE